MQRCPKCGGKIAPAWLKECRLPGEEKLRTELRELYERKKKLDAQLATTRIVREDK